jgi:multicomponent Na+:H+ antiporter subunit F
MIESVILVSAVLVALTIIAAIDGVRRGPTVFDRLVGAALAAANAIVLLVLIGFIFGRIQFFVDIALAYAMLAFMLPIALGKYVERRGR